MNEIGMDEHLTTYQRGLLLFIMFMTRRMIEVRGAGSTSPDGDTFREAKANFYFMNIEFGDEGYDWTPRAAYEWADEFLSYDNY